MRRWIVWRGFSPDRRTQGPSRAGWASLLGLVFLTAGCAGVSVPFFGTEPVATPELLEIRDGPPMDQLQWGIFVAEVDSVEVNGPEGAGWSPALTPLVEEGAHRKFIPASNMKLPLTAAALSRLGPDYRYETAFYATAEQDGDFLRGDLILPARGDPTLGEPFRSSGEAALEELADSLVATGVRVVEGALVVDVSAWDSTSVPDSWMLGNLMQAYGAGAGAFVVDRGRLNVVARGDPFPGRPAQLRWSPLGEPDFLENQVTTVEEAESGTPLEVHFGPERRQATVSGGVPPARTDSVQVAIRDPVRQAAALLHRLLLDRGVEIHFGLHILWEEGEPLGAGCESGSIRECDSARRLAALESPPLSEIAVPILARSDNWISEQLARTLGMEVGGRGELTQGLEVVREFLLEDVGVDSLDFQLRDGSGLSTQNLLTPRAVAQILHHVESEGWATVYRQALAAPGRPESTLEDVLPELEGRLFAKTGTLTNVNSLSGYLDREDGRRLVFSILTNGSGLPADPVRSRLHEMVRILDSAP